MNCGVRVRVLGPVAVETATGCGPVSGQRQLDVLAVLAQRRGREVSAELLLELVWGDAARRLAPSAVHTVVARLRRSVGAGLLRTGLNGYALASAVSLDAADHDQILRAARDLRAGGQSGDATLHYRRALALWSGPTAYEGVTDELVVAERARLGESRATATEELIGLLLDTDAAGRAEEASALADELVAAFPLRESPYRLGMRASYALGRQGEALRLYSRLRARLRDELGIDPSTQSQALHRQILAQPDVLEPSDRPEPGRLGGVVPVPVTATVAREGELGRLAEWWADGARLVTLVGPGGVGKSRLLQQFGRDLRGERTVYVDLAGVTEATVDEIVRRIAVAQSLPVSAAEPLTGLATALARTRKILLIDEAETAVPEVATVVTGLLRHCPDLRILLTSRRPLEAAGERLMHIAPLACPDIAVTGAAARTAPAVRLLEARLRDQAPELEITDADGELLGMLAREVDGLPLGLELLAGHASTRSLGELEEMLHRPLDVAGTAATVAPRHHSLREAVRWSVDRLDSRQSAAFRRVGVFAAAFSADAAGAVIGQGDPRDVLRSLFRDAVLQLDRRGPRVQLRLLRIVRELALERLEESGEIDLVQRRHRQWFAARWRGASFHDAMLFDVSACYDDYLQALQNALETGDGDSLGGLGVTLGWYWVFHESANSLPWLDRMLESGLLHPVETAKVSLFRRALDAAFACHPPALTAQEIDRILGDDPEWRVLSGLVDTFAAYVAGEGDAARDRVEGLVEPASEGAPHLVAEVLASVAVMRAATGLTDGALSAAEQAWRLIGAAPGVIQVSAVVSKVGLALLDAGHPRRALTILAHAIESVDRRFGVPVSNALLINAGWAALGCAEHDQAACWFDRVLQRGEGVVEGHLAEAVSGAAATLRALGVPGADDHITSAAELCRRHGIALCPWLVGAVGAVEQPTVGERRFVATRDDELADPIIDALHGLAVALGERADENLGDARAGFTRGRRR